MTHFRRHSLYLFLVSGDKRLDAAKAAALTGEALGRVDPREIRDRTGFAIDRNPGTRESG